MKNKALASILFLALFIIGCKDALDDLLTFTISDQVAMRVESSSPLNLPIEIATPDVTTNSDQKFKNNNTNASLVKDVKLQELKLTITNPAGKTFSFLKSVRIFISTDQQAEIELAHHDDIPATATSVTLITTTEKLDAYAKASSYKLRTSMVMRETLTQPVDVNLDLKFKVTATPL